MTLHLKARSPLSGERGAALVTVLLFAVLTFILISTMLSVTTNEVVIAALHRDGVVALEMAEAGIQEAVRRIEEGHPFFPSFASSLGPGVTVTVARPTVGNDSAYLEIHATGTVGRVRRGISALVLQISSMSPPNITFASRLNLTGSSKIPSGDIYSRSYVQYQQNAVPNANSLIYAGWRISSLGGPPRPPCYKVPCSPPPTEASRWYPATRLAEAASSPLGRQILDWAAQAGANGCNWPPSVPLEFIPGGAYLSTNEQVTGSIPIYGFDTDDPDGASGAPSQIASTISPCGLPYKWEPASVPNAAPPDGDVPPAVAPYPPAERWFKHIVFEQWFANYWRFDELQMTILKRDGSPCSDAVCLPSDVEPNLVSYPLLGAVPPTPEPLVMEEGSYDRKIVGSAGDNYVTGASADFGCKWTEMAGNANCLIAPTNTNRPVAVFLEAPPGASWHIQGNLQGHGTLVIDGNAIVEGTFEYWGTVIVNGKFITAGAGTSRIHGGLVTQDNMQLTGTFDVFGGVVVGSPPIGRSTVLGRAWWER